MTIRFVRSNARLAQTLTGLLAIGISQISTAQDDTAQLVIEEITVTAERRAESVQKVPVAITAFSGEEMRLRGIEDLEGVAIRTPSFVFDSQDQAEPNIYVRGVGSQAANDAAAEMPVAVYVDDVYIGRSGAANFELFDLERVEVLRGPQGTLFGRNSSGGVIHLVTQKPQEEFSARVRATVGNFDRINVGGMVTGPISDNVFYKLAVSSRNRDGFVENLETGNDNADEDALSVRGALRFLPSDALEINVSADYNRERGTSSAHDTEFTPGFPVVSDPRPFRVNAIDDGNRDRDIWGAQVRVDYEMDWATLTSITAYRDLEYDLNWYFAGNPLTEETIESFNTNIEDSQQFSQELRLAGATEQFDWVGGFFYYNQEVDRQESFDQHFNGLFNALGLPGTIGQGLLTFFQDAETESWALFAQGTYRFTDQFSFTAGLRYTEDTRDYRVVSVTSPPESRPIGISAAGPYDTGPLSESWDAFTPRFAFEYQATDDALIYASATRGFKSGVFLGTASTIEEALLPLDPEKVWSYEVGAKTRWADDRVQFNVAGFFADFKDLQLGTLIPGQAIIRENASADVKGIEVELLALPTEGLSLQANYSYLDNKFTDEAKDGNRLPRSPKNKVNVSGAYSFPAGDRLTITARADWVYQSKFFHEPDNRETEIQDSYDMIDASIDIASNDDTWRVSLWGRNLGDELVTRSQVAVAAIGQNYVTYAPPRTYGATVTWNFR